MVSTRLLQKPQPLDFRPRSNTQIRRQNLRHHERVGELGRKIPLSPIRTKQILAARKKYFANIRRIPFVNKLLSGQVRFEVPIGKTRATFTLLKTGLKLEGLNRPVVVVLDNWGRKMLFYKSTGMNSKKPGTWLPFKGLEFVEFKNGEKDWWYQKYAGHPHFPEYLMFISEEIKKREHEVEFNKKWGHDEVNAINEYF